MSHVEMDRRTILKTAGVGIAMALAGLKADEVLGAEACGDAKSLALPCASFHHIGVPTQTKHEDERFLEGAKVYITDPDKSPYHIEWCRWLPESKEPEIIRTRPHLAFVVANVDAEIAKYAEKDIFAKPYSPFEGVKVAFINHEGFLVEFLQKL